MSASDREFHIILWGASGFTGRLVAEYLFGKYGNRGTLRWALAGRNQAKLEAVRNGIGAGAEALPILLADADDEASLRQALELDGSHKPAAIALARLLLDDGRASEAVEVLAPIPDDDDTRELVEAARSGALPTGERTRIEGRLTELLDLVKVDDEARGEFIGLLDELSVGDPTAVGEWRKKLSIRLF